MKLKKMSPDEREAHTWQIMKQLQPGVEISDEQLRELGLLDWVKEDNSIERMRLIFFCCTAIMCTIWVASDLVAYFTEGNMGMFIALPLIAYPVYKTIQYFAERGKQVQPRLSEKLSWRRK